MLRIKSTIYLTGQENNNDPNSKFQTPQRFEEEKANCLDY
jgi:hypothetical protein